MHEQRDSRTPITSCLRAALASSSSSPDQHVRGQVEKLPPEQRRVIAGKVNSTVKTLNELFYKVLAIPGVAQELKPIVEAMKVHLATLTTAT
jgi:hypothetical protein